MLNLLVNATPTTWREALEALRYIQANADLDPLPSLIAGDNTWHAGDILLRNGSGLQNATAVLLVVEVYPDGLRTAGFVVHSDRVEIKTDWRMGANFLTSCSRATGAPFRPAVRKM